MGEEDMRSQEFVDFIRSNREMILKILGEDDREQDTRQERYESPRDRFREYRDEAKEQMQDTATTVLKVLSDDEVQKHFFAGCMELLMCMESVLKALPKSPEMQEVVDNLEKTKKNSVKNVVVTGAKAETRNALEKVSITNLKKKIVDGIIGNDEDEDEPKPN